MSSPTSRRPLPLESMMSKSFEELVTPISRSSRIAITFGSCMTSSKTGRETAICRVSSSSGPESGLGSSFPLKSDLLKKLLFDFDAFAPFLSRVQILSTISRSSWATRTCSFVRAACLFCWLCLAVSRVFSTKIAMTKLKTPNKTKHVVRTYPMVQVKPRTFMRCGAKGTPSGALQSPIRHLNTVNIDLITLEKSASVCVARSSSEVEQSEPRASMSRQLRFVYSMSCRMYTPNMKTKTPSKTKAQHNVLNPPITP
mmetsp:Transcript_123313/g.360059  ORF Transcript_123313/g.360059 Transcript_123313/m.360059 type:complete len:256 (+) Transcript_123313:332-1099(+)